MEGKPLSGGGEPSSQVSRDKSVERNKQMQAQPQVTVAQTLKELQKAKKMLKEKDKEISKIKAEVAQIKKDKELTDKEKLGIVNAENQVKTLQEKLKNTKVDNRRKDEKLAE